MDDTDRKRVSNLRMCDESDTGGRDSAGSACEIILDVAERPDGAFAIGPEFFEASAGLDEFDKSLGHDSARIVFRFLGLFFRLFFRFF